MPRVVFASEEIADLDRIGRRVLHRAGEFCFLQGDPGDAVFLLRSGRVRLSRITTDGRELTLAYLKPGEPFGELALVDGGPRETQAEAVEDSEVTQIRTEDLESLLASRPRLAITFTRLLGQRNKAMADKVEDLVFRDVPARLAGLLLALASDFGVRGDRGTRFPFKITHRELAACIGSSRETVSQTLTLFARDRLIARKGRQIIITGPDGLSRLSGRATSGPER